jgi:hypothetical protein
VLLTESLSDKILQVAIGECKGHGEITVEDVRKLTLVADALSQDGDCEAFIVFAKTREFTPEEVERCKAAQGKYGLRVILLSDRELETYFVYERAQKEFVIDHSGGSLERMAQATQNIYFEPKRKSPPQPPVDPVPEHAPPVA